MVRVDEMMPGMMVTMTTREEKGEGDERKYWGTKHGFAPEI